MNKKLHFTWWHIFAFIAIIFIMFASFMGVAFQTEGDFLKSGLIGAGVVLVFVLFFLVPQQLKATEVGFSVCAWFERILLLLSIPATIAFAMLPLSPFVHFSAIVQKAPTIESKFAASISSFDGIFEEYENYTVHREKNLATFLSDANLQSYEVANRKEILHLMLMPQKYLDFKSQTVAPFIEKARSVKVWNVHTVSNLSNVRNTADSLVSRLECQSSKILSFENESQVSAFNGNNSLNKIKENVDQLARLFKDNNWSWLAAICAFMGAFFMIIPYLAQQRNAKNPYTLFSNDRFRGKNGNKKSNGGNSPKKDKSNNDSSQDFGIDIVM